MLSIKYILRLVKGVPDRMRLILTNAGNEPGLIYVEFLVLLEVFLLKNLDHLSSF